MLVAGSFRDAHDFACFKGLISCLNLYSVAGQVFMSVYFYVSLMNYAFNHSYSSFLFFDIADTRQPTPL